MPYLIFCLLLADPSEPIAPSAVSEAVLSAVETVDIEPLPLAPVSPPAESTKTPGSSEVIETVEPASDGTDKLATSLLSKTDGEKNEGELGKAEGTPWLLDGLGANLAEPCKKTAIEMPLYMCNIMLGPVREANMLLPQRLDPFSEKETSEPWIEPLPIADAAKEEYSAEEQAKYLGRSKMDLPGSAEGWHWQATLSGSFRQGNASTTNVRSLLQMERRTKHSMLQGKVGGDYNRTGDGNDNQRANGEILFDRNLRGRWICYARDSAEYDAAALIDLRSITSAGLGFKFIDRLRSRLIARTGPTVSYWLFAPEADSPDEIRSGWMLESEYRRMLGKATRVEWTATAFPDFDNEQQFRVRNEASIIFPIGGPKSPWNWKLGVNHTYQLNPVDATKTSDVEGYFAITFAK